MRINPLFWVLIGWAGSLSAQLLPDKDTNEAWTYTELIESYKKLDQLYLNARYLQLGTTDCGRPLSLFLIQKEAFRAEQTLSQLAKGKLVTLINNGIHPGESCGMDASIMWANNLLALGGPAEGHLIAIIPVYNIGGSLQARPHTRANQNGPELQGFRGNARNLDLNRDFIKGDALNTFSFWALYQALKPHIFVDTHTSNGADYPYTLTLIATQQDKLAPSLAQLQQEKMLPYLYAEMAKSWPMVPYVNVFGRPPNDGYAAFLDSPRYASGYTSLFHSLGFITEAHMFKSYPERVMSTYQFLQHLNSFSEAHRAEILLAFEEAQKWEEERLTFPVAWELDSNQVEQLDFKAFEYSYEPSELGSYRRLKYHRDQIEELKIPYYPHYKPVQEAYVPKYYVIPQAWREVVSRLQYQNIEMRPLAQDTLIEVRSTYLKKWNHSDSPYEGHFRTEVEQVEVRTDSRLFYAGDYLVPGDQLHRYFLASVLSPMSVDSYLSWGFFDIIFQQKEYFSPYVFEDKAMEMLKHPLIKKEYDQWMAEHQELQRNPWAVLSFFYQRSEYYEMEHLRYPIAEIY